MKKRKTIVASSIDAFNKAALNRNKEKYVLRLYITGKSSRSVIAVTNINKICKEYLAEGYDLEVIDLFQFPALAKEEQIIAAPTLIKKSPLPFRRIIGDMSNKEKVLTGLDLHYSIRDEDS